MNNPKGGELFLTLQELKILFPLLKKTEERLSPEEAAALKKIESILYEHLSVEEAEALVFSPPGVS